MQRIAIDGILAQLVTEQCQARGLDVQYFIRGALLEALDRMTHPQAAVPRKRGPQPRESSRSESPKSGPV